MLYGAKTSDGGGGGSYSSQITGLNPQTTYYLRAYATNSTGTSYGPEISFTTLVSSAKSHLNAGQFLITPNPASERFSISGLSGIAELSIQNAAGKEFYRKSVSSGESIDVSTLPPAIYLYSVQTASGLQRGKLILKQK